MSENQENEEAIPHPAVTWAYVWVFKVPHGEQPISLVILRDQEAVTSCRGGYESPWLKLGTDQVSLSLKGLPSLNDIAEVQEHSAPVRLGQLEITLTAAGLASGKWDGVRFLTVHGQHVVVISLALKNVSNYPNCTAYGNNIRLFDNRSFEYTPDSVDYRGPAVPGLLPGEGTGRNVRFAIWDGTAPRQLTISRNISWETSCAEKQHRPVDMHGGSTVRIPITAVPTESVAAHR